ncbi:MAG: metallophosphoesterase [Verrucomicrobia bacterium]|nr:metallophosphoesterase [Verrucomicrobiota bacterium]
MLPFACALAIYMFFEARVLKVRRLTLRFPTLPEAFDGFTLLHLSDLHLMRFGTIPRQLLEVLPTLPADLVVLTGDYKRHTFSSDAPIPAWMGRLVAACAAPRPALAVLGNKDSLETKRTFAPHGIDMLINESRTLQRGGQQIHVLGVDAQSPVLRPDRAAAILDGLPQEGFRILLAHTPDYVRAASERGIELVLAGDTHGGQILLPFVGAIKVKARLGRRYCRGIIREGATTLYISSGCGTANLPFRLLCPPEVSMLTLRRV